jgi:hypothetical protein
LKLNSNLVFFCWWYLDHKENKEVDMQLIAAVEF